MKKILIACPVLQKENIFIEYLKSLDSLDIPEGYEVERLFVLHNNENLKKLLNKKDKYIIKNNNILFETGNTHYWKKDNLSIVASMKNEIIKYVLENNYDYWFLVDSDLILEKNTLKVLLERNKDLISEIFWTEWNKGRGDYSPNCWDIDYYGFINPARYEKKGCFETGGTGACFLIKREVLEKGVNYFPISNVSFTEWEDRAFCIRAKVMGYDIYVDTTVPALHLYREDIYDNYMNIRNKERE